MGNVTKRILVILVIMAVLAYIIYNHMIGQSDTSYFVVATALLSFYLISMIRGLCEDLRKH